VPHFLTCDVFTDVRFGGNPLAVLPDARGLSVQQMQQVAREFNYSETTFVLPAERGGDRRVRIFTPAREVPFAGHPTIGTAFALAMLGELGIVAGPRTVTLEEAAGMVPVEVRPRPEGLWCELRAPEPLALGATYPLDAVAPAVGLAAGDLRTDRHLPCIASVGLPFLVVEVADLGALARSRPDPGALQRLAGSSGGVVDVHLYVRTDGPVDLRARMFAPLDGVSEDPATGSANAALAGLLGSLEPADGRYTWRIAQGVEMGRPSLLEARVERRDGIVVGVWVGGSAVLVSRGTIEV
jgi:trans-2,3-dihydro-3-hydroxyanthranilate isomerase